MPIGEGVWEACPLHNGYGPVWMGRPIVSGEKFIVGIDLKERGGESAAEMFEILPKADFH